ncbi:MAG: hypothetical protein HYS18_07005 [Burkholderiales bacterium]|nr:hypothetical protein [Burkholderiales bacterium]
MKRFLFSFLAACIACGATAQSLTWTKTGGPLGGLGYNVRVHPTNKNIIFVTDAWSGVNRSLDGGATWQSSNNGITTRTGPSNDAIPVFSLAIDSSNPNIIWVGTQGVRGIFKSTDGGTSWVKKDSGIAENTGLTIRNFQIKPGDSNTVYATGELSTGIQGTEFERVQGVLYKTTDGGANWTRVWLGDSLSRWLTIDPSTPQKMLMATGIFDREAVNITGLGMLRTQDGGASWTAVNSGLTSLFVGGLVTHPTLTSTSLIATGHNTENNAGTFGGVYRSIDGGTTWTRVLAPQNPSSAGSQDNVFNAVTYAPSNSNIVYAGNAYAIYRSSDGGLTWTRYAGANGLQWGPEGVRAGVPIEITVDRDDPNTLLVNCYGGGVLKSTNGGQTWQVLSKGYTGAQIHKIAVSAQNPGRLLAIGRSGPFVSTDAGSNWTGVLNGTAFLGEGGEWYSAAISPANPAVMLIGDEHQGGIFRSTDGGSTWTLVYRHSLANTSQFGRQGIQALVYAPSNAQVAYAGFSSGGFFTGPMDTVPNTSFGVYRSDDGGLTWTAKNTGLTSTNMNIAALAVSATNSSVVYAGTRGGGIYRSLNSGEQWTNVTSNLPTAYVFAIALSPTDSNTVYVGTGDQGIFKSVNGGSSWTQVLTAATTSDTLANKIITSIVVDPRNANNVYAADWNSGVFRSTTAGLSWQQVNTGLSMRAVNTLTLAQDGRNLYAGTKGEGVFRVDTATGSDVVNFAPASGWWWNPTEGGRGYTIEKQGSNIFMAAYMYDTSGRATWYAAGPAAVSGTTFTAPLLTYMGGQTLTGGYTAPTGTLNNGNIGITFSDTTHGIITWPNGSTTAIERYNIVANGASAVVPNGTPQAGWWWNSAEGGRGFSIEIQNGTMFLAGYMYDGSGNPIWYASGPTAMSSSTSYLGTWQQYGNGQTLGGAYRSASVVNSNVGNISISFSSTTTGTLTLPDGRQISISRYNY